MKMQSKPFRLVPLLMVCAVAPAFAADLPSCSDANYDGNPGRQLFTLNKSNTSLSPEHPLKSQFVNQQCLLTVVPRDRAARLAASSSDRRGPGPNGAGEMVEGPYVIYLSDGGDGGGGGAARRYDAGGGGGGGGAGAIPVRQEITLTPGVYKLTLGAGGPGGARCGGPFGGGPGWGGSPTSIMRVSDGQTIAGLAGADTWQRPSRYANDKLAGRMDGHGGYGPNKTAGGEGGLIKGPIVAVAVVTPEPGVGVAGPAGPIGTLGQPGEAGTLGPIAMAGAPGTTEQTKLGALIVGGGGGGAGTGAGGDGAGEVRHLRDVPPQPGGLGAGGGGGEGGLEVCSAGAPGGNGYIALRPIEVAQAVVPPP